MKNNNAKDGKVKEFLGDDPKAAAEGNPEEAGMLLIQRIGWYSGDTRLLKAYRLPATNSWIPLKELATNLNRTREAELAVIEKVGAAVYGKALLKVLVYSRPYADRLYVNITSTATASAPVRVAACLLALSTLEENL